MKETDHELDRETAEGSPAWTIDTLTLLRTEPATVKAGVELGAVIGEGGMGVVRSATQRSLGRDVAVKMLRAGREHGVAVSKLLREALITGSLEHPNIVPVYDLGLDERDSPMLVLKRISGTSWQDLLGDHALVLHSFGAADALEWHLRTLMQVCSAIHFAHKRGILHRDIKPANVMVGEFGEVYVLDWGLAVATKDDGTQRFPLASNSTDVAGTPVYMAPEMFGGETPDARTDVYLLGATLYEIAAGSPPHRGRNFTEIFSSLMEPPPTPDDAPPELPAIWLRAMAYERADRFASAEELRLAIQRFLDHRGSNRLAADAATSLAVLEADLAKTDADSRAAREAIYNSFGECAFGFRQALGEWPENEAAARGLREATERMIRYEIAQDDPRAARLHLARLDPPDAALEADVARLERRAARSADRTRALEELGRDRDPNVGRRGRTSLMLVLGLLWIVVPLVVGRLYPSSPDYASLVPVPTLMLVVVLVGAFVTRRSMMRSAMNRALVGAAALTFFSQIAVHAGSALAHVAPDESQRFIVFIWFVIAAMMAITVSRRLAFSAVAYLFAYLASSHWFPMRYEIMAASNTVLFVTVLTWAGRKRRSPRKKGGESTPPPSRG